MNDAREIKRLQRQILDLQGDLSRLKTTVDTQKYRTESDFDTQTYLISKLEQDLKWLKRKGDSSSQLSLATSSREVRGIFQHLPDPLPFFAGVLLGVVIASLLFIFDIAARAA